jgi:hypothetical protein
LKKIITGCVLLALLALSCGNEGVTSDPDPHYRAVPTSPRLVLVNVETAFNHRDVNLLKATLSENFVFYFDPADVGQNPPGGGAYVIPDSWAYTEFWQAVNKLFELAYSIDMTIYAGGVGEPDPEATTYRAENVPVRLLVMVDENNGYICEGRCDFEFEKYLGADGRGYWRLPGWWDKGYGNFDAGATPTSLGKILTLYR